MSIIDTGTDSKLLMLGYKKLEFNGVMIYNNRRRHSLVIVDKQGKQTMKNYLELGDISIQKRGTQIVIRTHGDNSSGFAHPNNLNITILSNGDLYVLEQNSCVVELETAIIMGNGTDVYMYDKATKRKHVYKGSTNNIRNGYFNYDSTIKIVNRHYLLINRTYIDFNRKCAYRIEINSLNKTFIGTHGLEMPNGDGSYTCVLDCVKDGKEVEFENGNFYVGGGMISFLINTRNGEMCKVLKVTELDDCRALILVESLATKEQFKISYKKGSDIKWDNTFLIAYLDL